MISVVTLALHLIGVMDFQGRHGSSGGHLGLCSYGARIGGLLGDTGGVSTRSWCRKQLHNPFRQGSPGAPLPLPSPCSPEPAILVWWEAAGKQALREKGVTFQATVISDVSQLQQRTACLPHTYMHARSHKDALTRLTSKVVHWELKLFILPC